jgi:glycine/D-amino acid oxidase-like deaminating enzyme
MPDATHGSPALPVVVIGAGPVGLAAAAHLLARGMTPLVLEAGAAAAASVRHWGHVRMFSPWRFNVDGVARAMLERHGWAAPDPDGYPTGAELVARYLQPLAALPEIGLRLGARVVGVSRRGHDLMRGDDRALAPFIVQVARDGEITEIAAQAVLDCSGTWGRPNPAGAHGLAVPGEAAAPVAYGIPDVLGRDRAHYAGRSVLVVGSGHSAMNAVLELAARPERGELLWAFRRPVSAATFGGGAADGLAERGALGARAQALAAGGAVRMLAPFAIASKATLPDGRVRVTAGDGQAVTVERVIVAAGFRPDLSFLSELRLGLDPAVQSTPALAPLIDPNIHSCGTVRPHGEAELRHPEPNFWIAGMKSYGRAPTFLMTTGHEQVRSIAAALAGDWAAAREVRLELPETGVCSGAPAAAASAGSCCAPTPALVVTKCCGG